MIPTNHIPIKTPKDPKFAYIAPTVSNGHDDPSNSCTGIGGNNPSRPLAIEYKYIPSSTGGLSE